MRKKEEKNKVEGRENEKEEEENRYVYISLFARIWQGKDHI